MKENLLNFVTVAPKWILVGVSFLLPVFFLTTSFDYFEYPKQILVWVTALVLTGLWLTKYALTGRAKLAKTPFDIPWVLLLVVMGVSAYLASYHYPAIMGAIGRAHPSLASFVAYFLIFIVSVNSLENIKDIKHVLLGFIAGTTLLALLSLLQFFGVFNFLYDQIKISFFLALRGANVASSNTSAAFTLALAIPMVLGWLSYSHRQGREANKEFTISELLLTVSLILMGSVIVIYNVIPAWIALIVGLLVFAFWQKVSTLRGISTYLSVAAVVLVVVGLLVHLPLFKENINFLKNQPAREIQLGFNDAWVISVHTVRDKPFFGSGLGSYSNDFTRYRQVGFNLNPNWNLRFNSSFNEYFNYLALIGLAGFLVYLFFIFRFLQFAKDKALKRVDAHEHSLVVGTTAAALAFFIGTLFTTSTTAIFFTFLLALILTVAMVKVVGTGLDNYNFSKTYSDVVRPSSQPLVVAIPGLILIGLAFFFGGKTVLANYNYRQAINRSTDPNAVLRHLRQAIILDPYVDLYHAELARGSFFIATTLARSENLSDVDRQNIQTLARQAIDQATIASKLDPLNVANFETLSSIYRSTAGSNQQVAQAALNAMVQASSLDPANPQIRLAIGSILYAAGQYEPAAQIFSQAVRLKPDLPNAHYNLANALVKLEKYRDAYLEYEEIKKLVQPGTPDYEKAKSEQDAIADKVNAPTSTSPSETTPAASNSAGQP